LKILTIISEIFMAEETADGTLIILELI